MSVFPVFFFFLCYGDHRDLHSFPTRRSSDLVARPDAPRRAQLGDLFEEIVVDVPEEREARRERIDVQPARDAALQDRKSTRLNSSHVEISYAVFCLKKKKHEID